MRDLVPILLDRLSGGPIAFARIIAATGSAPRAVGTAMAVTASGEVIGSLSGGCVEAAVVHSASDVLETGRAVVEYFGVTDGDTEIGDLAIGLTCGGEIEVFIERLDATHRDQLAALQAELAAGRRAAWATTLDDEPRRLLTTPGDPATWLRLDRDVADLLDAGHSGIVGTDDCDNGTDRRPRTFVQVFAPPRRLILVGANDFVRALASLGRLVGMSVTVVDARAVFATPARFPDADDVIVDWPDRYLRGEIACGRVDSTTALCVMTHDHKFDVPALDVALRSPAIGFVGAMGSRRTHADRLARLRTAGVGDESLARLRSPLGLDLGGHSPAETAVSIVAQLIAERHAASAVPLTQTDGPIHHR